MKQYKFCDHKIQKGIVVKITLPLCMIKCIVNRMILKYCVRC